MDEPLTMEETRKLLGAESAVCIKPGLLDTFDPIAIAAVASEIAANIPAINKESDNPLEARLEGQGIKREEKQAGKTPRLAKVDRFGEEKVRCIVNFHGFSLPVAFPKGIIESHALAVGDEFDWYPSRGRALEPDDIKPIRHEPLNEEERKRLDAFVDRGRSMKEILADL